MYLSLSCTTDSFGFASRVPHPSRAEIICQPQEVCRELRTCPAPPLRRLQTFLSATSDISGTFLVGNGDPGREQPRVQGIAEPYSGHITAVAGTPDPSPDNTRGETDAERPKPSLSHVAEVMAADIRLESVPIPNHPAPARICENQWGAGFYHLSGRMTLSIIRPQELLNDPFLFAARMTEPHWPHPGPPPLRDTSSM